MVKNSAGTYLGIEGGGTRTVALLAAATGQELKRVESGPANVKLLSDEQLRAHLQALAAKLPRPDAIAIGLAGAWTPQDASRISAAAAKVWPGVPCYATHDLETALTAARDGNETIATHVLVVSGTGSSCYGRTAAGEQIKVGGWGHLLGDKGSGYEVGLRGLKAVAYYYDLDGVWPELGSRILRALNLNEPDQMVSWAQQAAKGEIAGLALEVFRAWEQRDRIATDIVTAAVNSLARDAVTCAKRVLRAGKRSGCSSSTAVQFVLAGSVLLKQERFASLVARELRKLWPGAIVSPLKRESVWGAVELARNLSRSGADARQRWGESVPASRGNRESLDIFDRSPHVARRDGLAPPAFDARKKSHDSPALPGVCSTQMSPTELRNPRSMHLDKMPVSKAVKLMLSEEAGVTRQLVKHTREIEQAVVLISAALKRGGRLIYVGAGTSGRLGVLDASECPPTFRTPPDMVQGIIAGGEIALRRSVEGAEDDIASGAAAIAFRKVGQGDVVVGIAASGTTPFVWGALKEAKRLGAATIIVCFNPYLVIPAGLKPRLVIAANLGPEVLTGSTRLKAGTATKLLLNIFTTLSMVRIGKVISNLMIDLHPANAKLHDRATRIVQEVNRADYATARGALERNGWNIKQTVASLRRKPR